MHSSLTIFAGVFGCARVVFGHLYHGVRSYDDYFILKKDAVGTIGFSGYQKCTAALRMLAYGTATDSWDDYLRMSESTCGDAMVRFATAVVEVFGPQYLREPTVADTERLLATQKQEGGHVCLDLLTACIGNGRTARRLYKGNIRVILRSPSSFFKQLHHRIFGFGTFYLACPGLIMVSMCCNDRCCL
ncbi:uncharacterized protein [Aegilops tauschii subsp. strangulata]|uniref:uncharacterized protein n=1 Tax=Aegilops tauschii subsp. strangulata TaxID=200361 RepID=UPI003CC8C29D